MNLLPCPFCGGEAKVVAGRWSGHGEGGTLYLAQCTKCGAEVPSKSADWPYNQEKESGEAGAIEAWNQRDAAQGGQDK